MGEILNSKRTLIVVATYYAVLLCLSYVFLLRFATWLFSAPSALAFVLRGLFAAMGVIFFIIICWAERRMLRWVLSASFIKSELERDPEGRFAYFRSGLRLVAQVPYSVRRIGYPFSPQALLRACDRVYFFADRGEVWVILEARALTLRALREKISRCVEAAEEVFALHRFECKRVLPTDRIALKMSERAVLSEELRYGSYRRKVYVKPDFVKPPALAVFEKKARGVGAALYYPGARLREIDGLDTEEVPYHVAECLAESFWKGAALSFRQRPTEEEGVYIGEAEGGGYVYMPLGGHVLVAGMTGAGKTNLLVRLARGLASLGENVLVIDWHGEFGDMEYEVDGRVYRANYYLVGENYGINPLRHFTVSEFADAVSLVKGGEEWSPMVRQVFEKALAEVVEERGTATLVDVYRKLGEMLATEQRADYITGIDAAMRRIEPLLHPAFNYDEFTLNFRGLVVLDLALLDEHAKRVFVNLLLLFIYKYYSGPRLYLILDEASNVSQSAFSAKQRQSPLSKLASQVRKYNIVFIVADQEPHLLEHSVQDMASHYFIFRLGDARAIEWGERVLAHHLPLGRDPSLELTSLSIGECFYIGPHGVFRVRVKREKIRAAWWWRRELEEKRRRLEEQRLRLITEVRGRAWTPKVAQPRIDEERAESIAKKHSVKKEKLLEVLRRINREKIERAIQERDWEKLAQWGLWDLQHKRLKKLGRAVLEYYGIDWLGLGW